MLGAAPWSLAVFVLTLPFALLTSTLYQYRDVLFAVAAVVNLIAFARVTFAWHRAVLLADDAGTGVEGGRGGGGVRYLVLLVAITIAVTALGRVTGDVPFVLYMVMNAPSSLVFFGALIPLLAVVWLPVLYLVATYGLSLPRVAATGAYGFRGLRAAMPYKRWPLLLMLLVLVLLAGIAYGFLYPLTYYLTAEGAVQGALATLLCVLAVFVVTAMYAVAYRDSALGKELGQ
ncbi:hypothetical protein ASB57_29740 [Bordetella sp. N]|nr:hypothetical protein ASB57_29740 [Bordetella sp. N]